MSWFLTVGTLKRLLNKYDDSTRIMVGDSVDQSAYDAEEDFGVMWLDNDGTLINETDVEDEESLRNMHKVIVIWPVGQLS